jgi:uncharacterized protein YecE (DUF72 family)
VTHAVRIGCSGWNYRSWREPVYDRRPASEWLERYAERFDTVEVNASFYRLPTRHATQRWADQTPDGFCFAVKASRYLTHIKRLRDLPEGIRRFEACIEPLRDAGKLGPQLWQLPESFHRDDERLARALDVLPPGRHAFEFRHPSWFAADVERLLREHDVALVIGDDPRRPFQTLHRTAGWTYVRFHHSHARADGCYTDEELATWARRIGQWRREGDVYAYFNNDWEAFAVRNAASLAERLGVAVATG